MGLLSAALCHGNLFPSGPECDEIELLQSMSIRQRERERGREAAIKGKESNIKKRGMEKTKKRHRRKERNNMFFLLLHNII